ADGQGPRRDVGGGAGGAVGGVVAGVGAADADARHADRLGRAHVLVVERRAGVAVREHVAADPVVAERDGSAGGAVVDLVDAGGADGQGPRRDVGGGAGGGGGGGGGGVGA